MEKEISKSQIESILIRKAWESPEFKQKLFTDPKMALEEIGYGMDADMEISVFEEDRKKMIFVLPPNPLGKLNNAIFSSSINPSPGHTIECSDSYTCLTKSIDCTPHSPDSPKTTLFCKKDFPPGPNSPKPPTEPQK